MGHAFVKGHCFVACLFKPLHLLSQMMQVVTINERSMRSKAIRMGGDYVQLYFSSEGMHF